MEHNFVFKKTSPLCYLPNGNLVCYKNRKILIMEDKIIKKTIKIPVSAIEKLFCKFNLLSRLFRIGIRTAIALDNEHVLLSNSNVIHELNFISGEISKGWIVGDGIRPLIFSDVKNIDGFSDGVYFGGYLGNNDKKPVNIYHRTGVDTWEIVYTFPQGTINHVHNVVADPYRQCLWILTGDFENAAAIWKITDGFKKVEKVVSGDQKWRGCVAFPIQEGLLYATDTPFSENHIFLLKRDGYVETLADICGSCIYGCQWKDKFVFSTTVEADGRDESLKKLLFSKKRGCGIKDNYVRLYIGDYANGFKEIYKEEKDWLPFIFQFGAFKFPTGVNNADTLYFQSVATKRNDMRLLSIKIGELHDYKV